MSNEDFSRSVSGSSKNIKVFVLGGVVFTTACLNGLVFGNTGKNEHREKCVCKFVEDEYKQGYTSGWAKPQLWAQQLGPTLKNVRIF